MADTHHRGVIHEEEDNEDGKYLEKVLSGFNSDVRFWLLTIEKLIVYIYLAEINLSLAYWIFSCCNTILLPI